MMTRFPVLLSGDGDLFVWGSNKRGQLPTSEPFLTTPTLVKRLLLVGEKVIHAWSGWTHIIAQTGETMLLICVHTTDSQHKDHPVSSSLSPSGSETGRVFTWGRGDYGQLGQEAATSQNPELLQLVDPSAEGGNLPAEVKVLHGATQVRLLSLGTHWSACKCFRVGDISISIVAVAAALVYQQKLPVSVQQGAADNHIYTQVAEGCCARWKTAAEWEAGPLRVLNDLKHTNSQSSTYVQSFHRAPLP